MLTNAEDFGSVRWRERVSFERLQQNAIRYAAFWRQSRATTIVLRAAQRRFAGPRTTIAMNEEWSMKAISTLAIAVLSLAATRHAPAAAQGGATAGSSSSAAPTTVRSSRDITFEEIEGKQLRLDLFAPSSGSVLRPAIVFVNNAGFIRSAKAGYARQATRMAELGFVCVSIETRASPEFHFPAPLIDVQAALRWMHTHAAEFRIDTTRIGVVGASSGGYVAAAIGTNSWSGHDWSGTPRNLRVQAVVAFNPVSDLPPLADIVPTGRNTASFLGNEFTAAAALWRDASLSAHITPDAAPFLLFHGTSDKVVPYNQSVELKRRLEAAGVSVDLFTADSVDHGFFNAEPWYSRTLVKMEEFLIRVLR
ncbi:MAG TPA: alpha/beta hydrolase [Gemmatimonadaceae bacterium]|nr:alpha/beta hydrolase [Gemmatimonadaceae bacterium]